MILSKSIAEKTGLNPVLSGFLSILAGSMLLAISSKIAIPMPFGVPFTMQTLVVLCLGGILGWRAGTLSVIAYIVEGAMGLPVFSSGAGVAYLFGPTGGYLFGFIPAVAAIGYFIEKGYGKNFISISLIMLAGTLLVYIPGALYLATFTGLQKALYVGIIPFLITDIIKIIIATILIKVIGKSGTIER